MANCLYNGVSFPALPKAAYEYALMVSHGVALADVYFSSKPLIEETISVLPVVKYYYFNAKEECTVVHYRYYSESADPTVAWELIETKDYASGETVCSSQYSSGTSEWANYDVLTEDGSVFLAASDPIPVPTAAPIEPTSLMQGWLVGRRLAAMRGKPKEET